MHVCRYEYTHIRTATQNQDKMKNQISNIALEGTHGREVMSGLLSWTGENLQALLFLKGGHRPEKDRAAQRKVMRQTQKDSPNHNLTGGKCHG
jgi:hypothetical protein